MTERLYYEDSFLTEFDAEVTGCKKEKGLWLCTLDRSAFYPTSGGQPHDNGKMVAADGSEAEVTDVECDGAGEVWHTVSRKIGVGQLVHCVIDAARRRDHMEQHGGEHLLAGAVWHHLHGTTIGLHLGKEDSSIDVFLPDGRTHLTQEEITLLEEQVDRWIRMDVPVKCYFVDPSEVSSIPLRKPPTVDENIRIVQYGDFEYCACGGTHPSRSGMIGQIKILSALPSKGKVRFTFVCGARAEARLRACFNVLRDASDMLSCHWAETCEAVALMRRRHDGMARELAEKNEQIARFIADAAEKDPIALESGISLAVVLLPFDDKKFLPRFVSAEAARSGMVIFAMADSEGEGFFCLGRPEGCGIDLRQVTGPLGARGGGRPEMVQGTVAAGELRPRLKEALDTACRGRG